MLFSTIIFYTLSNAVTTRRDKSILYARIAIPIFICSIIVCLYSLNIYFIDNGIGMFGGLYQSTVINNSFQIFMFIITGLILQLNAFYPRKIIIKSFGVIKQFYYKLHYYNKLIVNKTAGQFKIIEYPLIITFVIMGGVLLMSSSDLVSLFLSIELQSYALYILCTVYRNSERSVSGGLTYFLLGGLSSCFILLASSLLYSNSGNTSFESIYVVNNISLANLNVMNWYDSYYIGLSLIIISVGFLFKVSAAPFHFWSPDVYDAIPTIVTTFVAIIAKISIFILLLELVHFTTNFYSADNFSWTIVLLISSVLSLIVGAVVGLTQFRIKRLFAYSTISHVGFILLALTINTVESVQSFIFYLMQYSISNLNAFLLLITIGFSLYCYTGYVKSEDTDNIKDNTSPTDEIHSNSSESLHDKNNSPIQLISQLRGYFNINSYLALSLTITLFSFVGIPPLIGFFAKQMVLSAALDNGYVFISFIAILTSVISAYYYLAVVKQMFFHKSNYVINPALNNWSVTGVLKDNNNRTLDKINISLDNVKLSGAITTTISVLTLTMLLFILIPNEWLNVANILALILFNNT